VPVLTPAAKTELEWLKKNPEFRERPATLEEFLGKDYLDISDSVRPSIVKVLREIMGSEVTPDRPTLVEEAIFTGGIGIGKTTVASIVLLYLVHWVLCLKDPQGFFNLMAGSRIAFMMMSTKASQAREVLFGDVKARVSLSPWFKNHPIDTSRKNQIRFDGDIWIVPGDSQETTFEGYNILGGVIDEADSHKITEHKDYAEVGFRTIQNRISSRFGNRGFLIIIGQMKSASGFAARKFKEYNERDDAYAARLSIWESLGTDHYRDKKTGKVTYFYYDIARRKIVDDDLLQFMDLKSMETMKIPDLYRKAFTNDPEEALKDLAGIPPMVSNPFILLTDRITEAQNLWENSFQGPGEKYSPISPEGKMHRRLRARDTLPRVAHVDIATSGEYGNSLGLAMGHISRMVEIEGELKPFITIDMLFRLKAVPGSEVMISDIRQFIYGLEEERGYRITTVTYDGHQSTESLQQLRKRGYNAFQVSVDKEKLPYHELKDAIYEHRIEVPRYPVRLRPADTKLVDIVFKELSELKDMGRKIDHPPAGSKDVADAMAAVVSTLMISKASRRAVSTRTMNDFVQDWVPSSRERVITGVNVPSRTKQQGSQHPAYRG